MVLTDLLQHSSRQYPRQPAFTMRMGYRTVTLTFSQVNQAAQAIAQLLVRDYGCQPGDCVIICGPNTPQWPCVWWGCVLAGLRVVPIAPEYTPSMLEKIVAQTEAKVFFKSIAVKHNLSLPTLIIEHILQRALPAQGPMITYQARPFDCVQIMYTSGTTGDPKGVMLTHENIMSNLQALRVAIPLKSKHERLLSILPLSHMYELTIGFLLPFSTGVQVIYPHSRGAIRDLWCKYHITKMLAVPEFLKVTSGKLRAIIQQKGLTKLFDRLMALAVRVPSKRLRRLILWPIHRRMGGCLNTIASGGAPLDPELEMWWDTLGIWVLQGYGLTETSPVSTTNTWKARKLGSVGKPLSNVQIHIADDGEILIKGPNVFGGYFKNPEKTAEAFNRDGFFKTGDMGSFDQDGFLFLKGRKKYMILGPGGQNVFPEDIETALNLDQRVKDSCVLGLEAPGGAIDIHAVLILRDQQDASASAIIEQANGHLATYQHITGYSVWPDEDFPRSITRKVKREQVLKAVLEQASITGQGPNKYQPVTPLFNLLAHIVDQDAHTLRGDMQLGADLKFDSLMRVELISGIEEQLGVVIDETRVTNATTLDQLEAMLLAPAPAATVPKTAVWPQRWWARVIRYGIQSLFCSLTRWYFKLEVSGLENIKKVRGPVMFMPNHVSLLDGMVLTTALPRWRGVNNSFAAGFDVLYGEYKMVAWIVELAFNAFPFPRNESDHVTVGLQNVGTMLDAGNSVTFFPEGHVSLDGKPQVLKKGAALVAQIMQAPVIPVKLIGLAELVPYDHLVPSRRGNVRVIFGEPLVFQPWETPDAVHARLTEALERLGS